MQINHQPLTRGHKTLGAKWLFDFWFSHQSSLYLASEVTPKPPTFHTASRCASCWETELHINNYWHKVVTQKD